MYKDFRQERIDLFQETKRFCQTDKRLAEAINRSRQQQKVIAQGEPLTVTETSCDTPAKVIVSQKRSFAAAEAYAGKKICVLNFASATNPGGGVERGSNAQEEALCRCSTLYPCISDRQIVNRFHHAHRSALELGSLNALYNDDCIYTPGVIVFRSDTSRPQLLPKDRWYEVDVISCAAPNLRRQPSNAMNPGSGSNAVTISDKDLKQLHKKRMSRILDIAGCFGAQVVIAGAFGCGAFQNPPKVVAAAMKETVAAYRQKFLAIEFAVYCPPRDTANYDIFKQMIPIS